MSAQFLFGLAISELWSKRGKPYCTAAVRTVTKRKTRRIYAVREHVNHRALRVYKAPQVAEYGSLREVTLAVGKNGSVDGAPGGAGASNKTSV